eukprot:Em0004g1404a
MPDRLLRPISTLTIWKLECKSHSLGTSKSRATTTMSESIQSSFSIARNGMEVQETVQRRSKRAHCQQELQISGEPFCDECGTNQRVDVASKRFKQDDEEYNCATSVHFPPHVICQLCSKPYKEPRILPCLHSFCEQCLHKEIERFGTKQKMECPTCQRSITIPEGGVNAIPRNLHLDFEVEVAGYMSKIGSDGEKSCDACIDGSTGPAVVFCCTCHHLLCKPCHDYHKHNKILHHHQIVGLDKESLELLPSIIKPIERLCSQPHHEKERLKLFSEIYELLTCNNCCLVLHKDHRIAELYNISKTHRDTMREALMCAQEVTSKLAKAIDANDKMAEQKEQLMKIQDEINRYTEMTSNILQTYTDYEMLALGDLLPTELQATLKKVENMSLFPNQAGDIHLSLYTDSLIKELSIFGHVMDSPPSPSQSTWSSESVIKLKEMYCVKVKTMTSNGERYPYGGLVVKAELRPKSRDGVVVPGKVEDHGDGTYTFTLIPQNSGLHQLLIKMDGEHVQKSPCDFDVRKNYSSLCNPEQVIRCSGGPSGIAIHDSGDIYVACCRDNIIRVFNKDGQQKRTIGSSGSGDGQFNQPFSLCIKGDVMYVADYGNDRVQNLNTGGNFQQAFRGSGQEQFYGPTSVIVDQRDRLIVADSCNDRVVILNETGIWLLTINGNVSSHHAFKEPYGLALDPHGNIHIAASANIIKVFTPEGTYVRSYGDVKDPSGIVIDKEGYSLINEYRDNRLSIFDPQEIKSTLLAISVILEVLC